MTHTHTAYTQQSRSPCTGSTVHRPRNSPPVGWAGGGLLQRTPRACARLPWTVPTPAHASNGTTWRCRLQTLLPARGPHKNPWPPRCGGATRRERPRDKRGPREKFGGNSSCSARSPQSAPGSVPSAARTKPPDFLVPPVRPLLSPPPVAFACGCRQPLQYQQRPVVGGTDWGERGVWWLFGRGEYSSWLAQPSPVGKEDGAQGGGGVRGGRLPRRPLGGARLRGGGHPRQGASLARRSPPLPFFCASAAAGYALPPLLPRSVLFHS